MASQKFTKSHLKSLVKECLLEILHEGAGSQESHQDSRMMAESRDSLRPPQRRHEERPHRRGSALDNVSWKAKEDKRENPNFSNTVKNLTSQITSDPVLSDIFADTAMTTLQEQVGAERQGPAGMSLPTAAAGDNAARIVNSSTPEELFSESAGKWAALAFGGDTPAG